MNTTSIYILERNNIPFYIGKSNGPNIRFYKHKEKFGEQIILEIIDEVPISEWKFWEIWYISLFKSWGFKLENKNNGGGGPLMLTQEHILKLKILGKNKGQKRRHKGKKFTQKHKDNIKPIEQYDLDGNFIEEFKSLKEANKKLKITNPNNSQIGRCANGYNKSSYGYIWKWKTI